MKILIHKEVPSQLVEAAIALYEEIDAVNRVIFDANIPGLNGKLGVFNPNTGAVLIDIGACIKNIRWMELGMSYIPNVWCNMLYTVFHEGAHAEHFDDEPEVFKLDMEHMDPVLEHAADVEALELTIDWTRLHEIPTISEMGWAGEQIRTLLNSLYLKDPNLIDEAIEIECTKAAGKVAMVAAHCPGLADDEDAQKVIKAVQDGEIGIRINGIGYLKIDDILEINSQRNRG